ncbi:MAG TPA: Flp family type IVb pilin [Actinomycetes bacterium]|jgi:hypothetical protein|nr:Flp family type IVb pilin [Actinomycetes bacterium]
MAELNILKYAYLMLRVRLAANRDDERGISTLESVLLVAGFATIALLAIAFITTKVNDAGDNIPTGPAGP